MHIVKIKPKNSGLVYLNLENIVYFYYDSDSDNTLIKTTTNGVFCIEGNFSGKLAKLIIASTNGSSLTLE